MTRLTRLVPADPLKPTAARYRHTMRMRYVLDADLYRQVIGTIAGRTCSEKKLQEIYKSCLCSVANPSVSTEVVLPDQCRGWADPSHTRRRNTPAPRRWSAADRTRRISRDISPTPLASPKHQKRKARIH